MLPFENMVDDYIDTTGNHVMYRVTPVFGGSNLVADGVLMEAYSVEDSGKGVSFCAYCYNVQPYVIIDYATGDNRLSGESLVAVDINEPLAVQQSNMVCRTPTGTKYHLDTECGGKNSSLITAEDALNAGLTPCAKCAK